MMLQGTPLKKLGIFTGCMRIQYLLYKFNPTFKIIIRQISTAFFPIEQHGPARPVSHFQEVFFFNGWFHILFHPSSFLLIKLAQSMGKDGFRLLSLELGLILGNIFQKAQRCSDEESMRFTGRSLLNSLQLSQLWIICDGRYCTIQLNTPCRILMECFTQQNIEFSPDKTYLNDISFFQQSAHIRASTAPSRPLSDFESFKLSKKFSHLQQTVVCSNQLLHKSFDKLDLDSAEGQNTCQKYLNFIENMCGIFEVVTVSRDYRKTFSQAYTILYKDGELSYLTEILDSAQEGFPCLYVNGEKFSFTQEVLDYGSRLMIEFYKLQHCLRDFYGKIMQETVENGIETIISEIKENLFEFDTSWSNFEKRYVLELMSIELKARNLIIKAIEAEQNLTSVQIRQKMKGKILINCEDYLSARAHLCEIISQINVVASLTGKNRDDLDHSILCETEGILRRITKDQSKAVRILGQKIRGCFANIRTLLKKYHTNIEMVDAQLKNNKDLVQVLAEYEKAWEKGGNYFCDSEKKRFLLHFSGALETIYDKYEQFQNIMEWVSPEVFLLVPYLLILKSLDKDDRNLCKYFLPSLNQIDTKNFRIYFELEKQFEDWKKLHIDHYHYYNILEKILIGVPLGEVQAKKYAANRDIADKIIAKIKLIGMELHTNGLEWNAFMEVCMEGLIRTTSQ